MLKHIRQYQWRCQSTVTPEKRCIGGPPSGRLWPVFVVEQSTFSLLGQGYLPYKKFLLGKVPETGWFMQVIHILLLTIYNMQPWRMRDILIGKAKSWPRGATTGNQNHEAARFRTIAPQRKRYPSEHHARQTEHLPNNLEPA
jgi:hypothetical protein